MIRIDRSKITIPVELDGDASVGGRERAKAILFFSNSKNFDKQFEEFLAYKHPNVVLAVRELCPDKCAYCESKYIAVGPVDVEHYRPKSRIKIEGVKTFRKPGYYWLAADWNNLLPSCIDCNRPRRHHHSDRDRAVSGKHDLFPIACESTRAVIPGDEANEDPLLINPCQDTPGDYIEFVTRDNRSIVRCLLSDNGVENIKGRKSINVFGLNRHGVTLLRTARLKLINDQIARVDRELVRAKRYPRDEDFRSSALSELRILMEYANDNRSYAGMAKDTIRRHLNNHIALRKLCARYNIMTP